MLDSLQVHIRIASAASTSELKMQRMLGASPRAAVDACYAVLDEILDISHRPMPVDVRPPTDRFVMGKEQAVEYWNTRAAPAQSDAGNASELLAELRRHEQDYPSLVHGPLCGLAADEIEQLRRDRPRCDVLTATVWQPIEMAPRDGNWIIALCNDGTRTYHVYWLADEEAWYGHQGAYGDGLFAPHGGWIPAPAPRSYPVPSAGSK